MIATICPALAQTQRPSLADSFRLGSGGGVLCQVQSNDHDSAIRGMFDRSWTLVCRDAVRPVGKFYALRGPDAASRLAEIRKGDAACDDAPKGSNIEGLGLVSTMQCRMTNAGVGYRVYAHQKGHILWVAEGLAGYDSALKLGLRTIIADRIVTGQVSVATTSVEDPVAFSRVQAGTLDPDQALAEGYKRNTSGNYAEAAEFFGTLQQRADPSSRDAERYGEYLVNRALQQSNLGEFAQADALFAEANRIPTADRVQSRLRRNFEALHLLNQRRYDEAMARIDQPVIPVGSASQMANGLLEISPELAGELNTGVPVGERMGMTDSLALTPRERSIFLDVQALQIRGTLLRLTGKASESRAILDRAGNDVLAVRDGRVISVVRLRSQILAEAALSLEALGDNAAAEAKMRESLSLLEARYPQTIAVNGARARLAAMLARHGKSADAMAEYRIVVKNAADNRSATTGLGNLLSPYFSLLADRIPGNPSLVDDMFLASQTLVRPGVADTQAILARELSEGSGEATRLFRQARSLERDIERRRIDLANLLAVPEKSSGLSTAIAAVRSEIATLENDQVATQAKLSDYPQYRAISGSVLTLPELRASLKPGEAYFKLSVVGQSVFALYADQAGATGYKVPLSPDQLDAAVNGIRDTISKDEGGQLNTYPFDVVLARQLYTDLLGPVNARIAAVHHLVFEPDGAMLRLPLNLLIASQPGVDAYLARSATPDADQFDFRGIDWLGRTHSISTAVSARAFRDARNTPASNAQREYLGFGRNAPVSSAVRVSSTRSLSGGGPSCLWPASEWNKPVSDAELKEAQAAVGVGQSAIVTGADFSDTSVMSRTDLAEYRILHFATHGLVTAPRPECPARPALLTSFGTAGSDGLLSFREIYDLRINADLVILSACDTAGKASVAATREAGVATGGGSALDGLVRAFIGAGGRSVLASHWPAPDEFKATERLISGLFKATNGQSVGDALADAQRALMDDPATSHPFYWSGFAVVGDGAQAMLSRR
ncbi:CHAT domain-containing protein [Aquisediminimonas profunda]|uniref:CHAT domain-containing protein n=1 Tax=Aquisediminimonas profunda TaxID=1550733 RepID=UPI001C631E0F|nr:CHAT domain-containing protein [Aquisediminimonas profunda]